MTDMARTQLIGLLLALVLALVACDGGGSDGQPAGGDGGEGDLAANLEAGSFYVEVTGDVTVATRSATVEYQPVGDGDVFEIVFTVDEYLVRVLHTAGVADGRYDLVPTAAGPTAEQPFAAALFSLTSPTPEERFLNEVTGTISIETNEDGDRSGNFNFEATSESGDRRGG